MKRQSWVLLLTILLISILPGAVKAAPPVPYVPYGTVKLNGADVPDGTEITAFCGGVQYGYTQTSTSEGESFYSMEVIGDDPDSTEKDGCYPGETVTFRVLSILADQTGTWDSGSEKLNLTATKLIPDITVEKQVNGLDADSVPGPYLSVGSDLVWTYIVTNTGETALTDIVVTDDNGTQEDTSDDFQVCGPFDLAVAENQTCTITDVVVMGSFVNIATATGNPPEDPQITDSDPAHYYGANPDTTLVKLTNDSDVDSAPGVFVEEGGTVTWTYLVENTGNVDLSNVLVVDDNGTPDNLSDDQTVCTIPVLAAQDSYICEWTGTAQADQYSNLAVVTGTAPGDLGEYTAEDISYYFGSVPGISLDMKINQTVVNAPPGPYLLVGAEITWDFELLNTGNVSLSNVTVIDDNGTPELLSDDQTACTGLSLASGESTTCSLSGEAAEGQRHHTATVSGEPPVGSMTPVHDDSYYFGADPDVTLGLTINGEQAASSPGLYVIEGSTLQLEYLVRNDGNVSLADVVVMDGATTVCTLETLDVSVSQTCSREISASGGQQSLTPGVTATPPNPLSNVSDNDQAFYFGASPSLALDKKTNGLDGSEPPGVYVLTGSDVTWTYLVTNTGDVGLTNISVVDDNGTPADPLDDRMPIGCENVDLAPGEDVVCSLDGAAQAGPYANTAVATGSPPEPLGDVSAEDSSHYFGTTLDVELIKKTNGQAVESTPGPLIAVGDEVEWTYTITNHSNVTIDFTIVDNPAVSISCSTYALAIGGATTCTASGTAVEGQYANTATVTVDSPGNLDDLIVEDTSFYYGVITGIDIEKSTVGQDADSPTGPFIKVGDPVNWTYRVTNTGNVDLTGISVTDDQGVTVACPADSLVGGESMTCTATGTAVEGQYANLGFVIGDPPVGFSQVSDTDPSHYYGSTAGIDIEKFTNGADVDTQPGPYVLVGEMVTWTYRIENTGNLVLTNIVVRDDYLDTPENPDDDLLVCEISTLAVGEVDTTSCSASDFAIEGQYSNVAYISADVSDLDGKVYDQDTSFYFGAQPSIQLTKKTNGVDADMPPGPYIPVGDPIEYQYLIENETDLYAFTEIEVVDVAGVEPDCPETALSPGGSMTCSATGSAMEGQQGETAHVNAKMWVDGDPQIEVGTVTVSDSSHYFGYVLGVELVKYVNGVSVVGPPGPELTIGDEVTFTYAITNTSNVEVAVVSVVDDDPELQVSCQKSQLQAGEQMTCAAVGTVISGGYSNRGQVTIEFAGGGSIESVQAEDFGYYTGTVRVDFPVYLPLILR